MKTLLLPALMVLTAAATAAAAELKPSHVSADAKWLMHLDVDQVRQSTLGERLGEEVASKERAQKRLDWVHERYGIDLRQDLHGLTAWGSTYAPHEGVLILHADYDREKVLAVVKDEPGYKTTQHGDDTIHTWRAVPRRERRAARKRDEDRGKDRKHGKQKQRKAADRRDHLNVSMAFHDKSTIVLAGGPQTVQHALAVLDGKRASLKKVVKTPLTRDVPEGTIFRGAAVDLDGLKARGPRFAVLAQFDEIVVSFGEQEGSLFLNKHLVADSPETARLAGDVARGFEAMLALRAKAHPKLEEIAKGFKFNQDGQTLTATWKAETDAVWSAVEEMKQHRRPRAAERRKLREGRGRPE